MLDRLQLKVEESIGIIKFEVIQVSLSRLFNICSSRVVWIHFGGQSEFDLKLFLALNLRLDVLGEDSFDNVDNFVSSLNFLLQLLFHTPDLVGAQCNHMLVGLIHVHTVLSQFELLLIFYCF